MRLAAPIHQFASRLRDLFIPRTCGACDTPLSRGDTDLCASCWTGLSAVVGGDYCRTCGREVGEYVLVDNQCTKCLLRKSPLRFRRFIRVGRYEEPLRSLILHFKERPPLSALLGRMLAEAIASRCAIGEIHHWVPIPSPWRRQMRRGFHPTESLTHHVAKSQGMSVSPLLEMTKYVQPFHHGMKADQRREAIRGAFAVVEKNELRGKTVCIIDDVTTTGVTLEEAKRAFREVGVTRIFAAVLAKVPSGLTANSAMARQPANAVPGFGSAF